MKVLMVNDYQAFAGAESHLKTLCTGLAKCNCEIHCLYPEEQISITEAIRGFKPDVLHVHNWTAWVGQREFLFNTSTPTIMSLHDYLIICPSRMRLYRGQPCPTPCCYECGGKPLTIPNQVEKIIFNPFSRHIFEQHGVETRLIPHGLDLTKWPFREGQREGVGFVAANKEAWWKGAAAAARLASKLNIPFRQLIGGATQPQVAELLRSVKILLYPCIYAETFGLIIAEAMASGAVVVAYDVAGGQKSLIKDDYTGFLVPPSEQAMLQEVKELLVKDLSGISQRARAYIEENHTAERMARDYLDLYTRLISSSPTSPMLSSPHHR